MRLINKLLEPKRLLVIWQAPNSADSSEPTGKRFIVGEITESRIGTKLKYYNNKDIEEIRKIGFVGLTAYPYDPDKEFNGNLIDVLSKRLPPSSRTDYNDYLESYKISRSAEGITTLSLLAYTYGKIAGDGFSFVHTFEGVEPPFDFTCEIAGFRYYDGMKVDPITSLQDTRVVFTVENDNQHDKEAVVIHESSGIKLGYVPKGMNHVLRGLMAKCQIGACVTKINGTRERPNVLLYITIT